MQHVVQMPSLKVATKKMSLEVQYPLNLPVVPQDHIAGATLIPMGNSYAVGVSQETTVDDIWALEPQVERLADQISMTFGI